METILVILGAIVALAVIVGHIISLRFFWDTLALQSSTV